MKKFLYTFLCILTAVVGLALIAAVLYLSYVFVSYHRLDDNIALEVKAPVSAVKPETVQRRKAYSLVSFNIGFGAYEKDFGFFMDGGTEARAWSRERLDANLRGISDFLKAQNADIILVQETDRDSTRSYHVDESTYLYAALPGYYSVFAENWDSPYLFYPFSKPHGKAVSGIMTFSKAGITYALRRSLPVETGVMKLADLDRCYTVSRLPAEGGRELVIYNLHFSAYTSDGSIAIEQLEMLIDDMQQEYNKGNWCIAGGDFNKDVVGTGSEAFGVTGSQYTWAQPIPASLFDGTAIKLIGPYDAGNPVPSCRNADGPYWEGQYQVTVDGFMVSRNVNVVEASVVDTGFVYSDHNPVRLVFTLN